MRIATLSAALVVAFVVAGGAAGQPRSGVAAAPTPRSAAPVDLTG